MGVDEPWLKKRGRIQKFVTGGLALFYGGGVEGSSSRVRLTALLGSVLAVALADRVADVRRMPLGRVFVAL